MKTQIKSSIVAVLFSIAFTSGLYAQGTAFTYSGRLNDTNGPANGVYDLEFRVFDMLSGGIQQGSTTNVNDLSISNGLFTVTLDPGANVFTGPARWLNIAVRPGASAGAYTNLVPRQPITATPYAIYAGKAMMLDGALPGNQLSGTYSSAVTLNNAANSFTGNGAGLINLNADLLDGLDATAFWKLAGNGGTMPGTHFLGTTDDRALELKVNNARALRLVPLPGGQIQFIAGSTNNAVGIGVESATIGGGDGNAIGDGSPNATIGGGGHNKIGPNAKYATISGGLENVVGVTDEYATIGGGRHNSFGGDAFDATIGGGQGNSIKLDAFHATISGGMSNVIGAYAIDSSIGGGVNNAIRSSEFLPYTLGATIAGGEGNIIYESAARATIGGGQANTARGAWSTVPGGRNNRATNNYSTVGGGQANLAGGEGSAVAGGAGNGATLNYSTVGGGIANLAINTYSTIAGGDHNTASGVGCAVGGGSGNRATNLYSTVGGGLANSADGFASTVSGGGSGNRATDSYSTVGGGSGNRATNGHSTVTGGTDNTAGGQFSAVGGGSFNMATGASSTIPGGQENIAAGEHSFAAGYRARALHQGAFVWADSQIDVDGFSSTGPDQFCVRASGGVGIGTTSPTHSLTILNTNADDVLRLIGPDSIYGYGAKLNFGDADLVYLDEYADDLLRIQAHRVGIGRDAPSNRLEVEGDASKTTAGSWLANSDRRIKQDIRPLTQALEVIGRVRPVAFRYTEAYRRAHPSIEDRDYYNVIAQEFAGVFPGAVSESGDKLCNGDSILQVDTYPATIHAIAAIQELNQKLEEQRKENAELKQRLAQLEQLMNQKHGGAR